MSDDETEFPIGFEGWCEISTEAVNNHHVTILVLHEEKFNIGSKATAGAVPSHYVSSDRVAAVLEKLGKPEAAKYLREKLPTFSRIRSGDLGELLATQYIREQTPYSVPISRLRWKDHRNMALRGDDVIGIAFGEPQGSIAYLKSEVKSRKALSPSVVVSARAALNANDGLPSPHALAFVADRLYETGHEELADRITQSQLRDGITASQVEHLLFTFSGTAPAELLKADLAAYVGVISQGAVGLHTVKHQEFIAAVYEIVGAVDEP